VVVSNMALIKLADFNTGNFTETVLLVFNNSCVVI